MKSLLKIVAVGTALALGTAAVPAQASERCRDDRGWETFGKVITGVAAFGLLAHIIHDGPPPVAVRVEHCAPPPPPRWIPGHYECRPERVCIPGYWSTVTEPAEYGWVRHGCHTEYVMLRPPCTRRVWVPERYEVRETRVWVEGVYAAR